MGLPIGRAALIALGLAATPSVAGTPAPAPEPEQAAWEILYWGRPIMTWRVGADGEGEARAVAGLSGSVADANATVWHFRLSPVEFGRLKAMIEDFMTRYAGRQIPCDEAPTDLPYGDISWRSAGRLAQVPLQFGCRSPEAQERIAAANRIDALVRDYALRPQGR